MELSCLCCSATSTKQTNPWRSLLIRLKYFSLFSINLTLSVTFKKMVTNIVLCCICNRQPDLSPDKVHYPNDAHTTHTETKDALKPKSNSHSLFCGKVNTRSFPILKTDRFLLTLLSHPHFHLFSLCPFQAILIMSDLSPGLK